MTTRSQGEQVDHPAHYNAGEIEAIDVIEDWGLGFHMGNVLKYVARAPHKGRELEDLQKAAWYVKRLVVATDRCLTSATRSRYDGLRLSPAEAAAGLRLSGSAKTVLQLMWEISISQVGPSAWVSDLNGSQGVKLRLGRIGREIQQMIDLAIFVELSREGRA